MDIFRTVHAFELQIAVDAPVAKSEDIAEFMYHVETFAQCWYKTLSRSSTMRPIDQNSIRIFYKGPLYVRTDVS